MRSGAIALAINLTAVAGCAPDARAVDPELEFPTRIVTPLCADAEPPITLELLRASKSWLPHKPSKDVRYYIVDLRVARRDQAELWLLVNETTFPSSVKSIHTRLEDPFLHLDNEPVRPRETWCFSGNTMVDAWPLGRASELSLKSVEVGTTAPRIPVTLGTIEVDGMSPQQWIRRSGASGTGEPRARAAIEPHCTTWFDLAAEAERANPD